MAIRETEAENMNEILCFDEVSYRYDTDGEHDALYPFSVRLYKGEKIAVLGHNGAGKSTFFLLANGVLRPQTGEIRLFGEPVGLKEKQRRKLRQQVGLVFQDPDVQLLAGTVEEEISFGPMNLGLPREEVQRRVQTAMESLQLLSYRTRGPQCLSGGEKRRVAIAGILAMEPNVMLLDEPASNLDPAGQAQLNQILENLHKKGITLLIATHDVDFAWQWADRVLVFREGRLEKDAAPADVFADEALIKRCGLESPMLWKVARALQVPAPHSPEGFAAYKVEGR